jgi:hypothetical protein
MEKTDRRAFLKNLVRSVLIGGSLIGCAYLFLKNSGKSGAASHTLAACADCSLLATCDLDQAKKARLGRAPGKDDRV